QLFFTSAGGLAEPKAARLEFPVRVPADAEAAAAHAHPQEFAFLHSESHNLHLKTGHKPLPFSLVLMNLHVQNGSSVRLLTPAYLRSLPWDVLLVWQLLVCDMNSPPRFFCSFILLVCKTERIRLSDTPWLASMSSKS